MHNKIFKKILGLFGYKLIDKKVFKNDRLLSTKSHLKINRLLENLFKEKKINNLIQIGANDGERFDILNTYIKKYKIKSLLVEPIKQNFDKLKNYYSNCNFIDFENSAISVNNEIYKLYKVKSKYIYKYSDHIPGITSFDIKHLLKHGVYKHHISSENVKAISIEKLIMKYKLKNLDLLFIDAEGYDGKIVIDFLELNTFKPIIILEYIHITNEIFKSLIAKLEKNNYIFFSLNENLVCYPDNDLRNINFN
jgi:FkbM family methyltransferase|tara:strand:- start:189 stop:941 length:753 start_codon:yes stop_codon:yes gene_type:complete